MQNRLVEVRRYLHQHPELSGEEVSTTEYLSQQLTAQGIEHHYGPGKRGIITVAQPAGSARHVPTIALRADIDALPIQEENEVPYRSANPIVMHACGHDAHSAMLLGALWSLREQALPDIAWRGIFQPSEEAGFGAREMMAHGALEGVDAIVALHVDPNLEAGKLAVCAGPQTAFCQDFAIHITGRGGHGARPFLTVDPVATTAHLVTLIYQAMPRRTDARDPLVVTIGHMEAGHAANVIPEKALLRGTIRALTSEVMDQARSIIERLCRGTATSFEAEIVCQFDEALPGLVNDPAVTAICQRAARQVAGEGNVITEGRPSMGAEDFADYLVKKPGCMIRVGVRRPGEKVTPLHTPTFDIDESALPLGAALFRAILKEWPRT